MSGKEKSGRDGHAGLDEDQVEAELSSRKRRKSIKQCLFCRKRKLKCDKNRPVCGTCASRGLTECVYVERFSNDVNTKELLKSTPNVELLNRIKELEEELKKQKERNEGSAGENPLRKVQYVVQKADRSQFYGCTSTKVAFSESHLKFDTYYAMIWTKVKDERQRWKQKNGYSTLKEVTAIEVATEGGDSVLEALRKTLPPFEQIKHMLEAFFNGPLYEGYRILDPAKTYGDLARCFKEGPVDAVTGMHPIIQLVPPNKKNYYCIGIITEIMCLVNYNSPLGQATDTFNKFLTAFVTAKVSYVERVQYLFLRYLYKNIKGLIGGDHSNTVLLTEATASTAIRVGLHGDIRKLFGSFDVNKGNLTYLENLWMWILYADFEAAISLGTPSMIPETVVDYKLIEHPDYGDCVLLKKILKPLRMILNSIHQVGQVPNLEAWSNTVKDLLATHFRPLAFYTHHANMETVHFTELDLYIALLNMVSVLSSLRRVYLKEKCPALITDCIQYPIQAISLAVTATEAYFDIDKKNAQRANVPLTPEMPLHLALAAFIVQKHFPRALTEVYVILGTHGSITRMSNASHGRPATSNFDVPLDSLNSDEDRFVGFKQTSETLSKLFKRWEAPENADMVRRLKRSSYAFVICHALERSSRVLYDHYLSKQNTFLSGVQQVPSGHTNSVVPNTTETQELYPENVISDEVLQELADDFWNSYGTNNFVDLFGSELELPTSWLDPPPSRLTD